MSKAKGKGKGQSKWHVNEEKLVSLIGVGSDDEPSSVLDTIKAAKNPEYAITNVIDVMPFKADAEMIGATAGRIYFRERNRLVAITCSDMQMRQLAERILTVLNAAEVTA